MARPKSAKSSQPLLVQTAVLADCFGLSEHAVRNCSRELGMPPQVERNLYPLVECVRWRVEWLAQRASGDSSEIVQARMRLYDTQREKHELEMSQMRSDLLVAEEVGIQVQRMLSVIATQLDGLGPRVAARLAGMHDPAKIAREILNECRNIRGAAADALADLALDLHGVEDPAPAAAKGRRRVGGRKPDTAAGQPGAGPVAN